MKIEPIPVDMNLRDEFSFTEHDAETDDDDIIKRGVSMVVTQQMISAAFGSYEKWLQLANEPECVTAKASTYCALCTYSLKKEEKKAEGRIVNLNCTYCPIAKLTGKKYCDKTPWEMIGVVEANNTEDPNLADQVQTVCPHRQYYDQWLVEAQNSLAEQFRLEFDFIAELCLYLIDCYQKGKSVSIKNAPQSLKDAMQCNIDLDAKEHSVIANIIDYIDGVD